MRRVPVGAQGRAPGPGDAAGGLADGRLTAA